MMKCDDVFATFDRPTAALVVDAEVDRSSP